MPEMKKLTTKTKRGRVVVEGTGRSGAYGSVHRYTLNGQFQTESVVKVIRSSESESEHEREAIWAQTLSGNKLFVRVLETVENMKDQEKRHFVRSASLLAHLLDIYGAWFGKWMDFDEKVENLQSSS